MASKKHFHTRKIDTSFNFESWVSVHLLIEVERSLETQVFSFPLNDALDEKKDGGPGCFGCSSL